MIEVSEEEWRRAFPIWLRTGKLPSRSKGDGIECKFNPWHDPEDGRFTFAGTGRYYGGGGSFGGGGATGTWKRSQPKPIPATQKRASAATVPSGQSNDSSSARPAVTSEPPFRAVIRDGYTYQIDSRERTRRVSGALTVANVPIRSRTAQRQAGEPNAGQVTMAAITSRRASMARLRHSTISRRMQTSIGAAFACLKMNGRKTSVPGGLSRSKSSHGLTEPLFGQW